MLPSVPGKNDSHINTRGRAQAIIASSSSAMCIIYARRSLHTHVGAESFAAHYQLPGCGGRGGGISIGTFTDTWAKATMLRMMRCSLPAATSSTRPIRRCSPQGYFPAVGGALHESDDDDSNEL